MRTLLIMQKVPQLVTIQYTLPDPMQVSVVAGVDQPLQQLPADLRSAYAHAR